MNNFTCKALAALLTLTCLCQAARAEGEYAKIRESGSLKVAVYKDFAPFSTGNQGIDIDIAEALAKKLGLRLNLLPFPAGEEIGDDFRNMVWKGHYMGYGPADVMLHAPVDPILMTANDKVKILAPYYREQVRLVRDVRKIPDFDGLDALTGKKVGVDGTSISSQLMLGAENGKFREDIKIYASATEALERLKAGELDAVLATRSEIESSVRKDPNFQISIASFSRLPPKGWVVGMAIKKDDAELADVLQAATDELLASGEMDKIFAKYGVDRVVH